MIFNLTQNKKNAIFMIIALIGLAVYISQSIHYAHKIVVTLDEGSYLLKGASYLRGEELPYQLAGMITNKTPLSFYIPGISQVLFGNGIRSGRTFSVFLGALMLVGLWLAVRRVSNLQFAAVAVWMVALNQNWLVYYARSMSQVISILFLVWCLYFILGEGRKNWELVAGGLMATLLVLTRQNMLPFQVLLYLYLWWQFGWRKALLTQLPGMLIFLTVHLMFWPGIYIYVWRAVLPKFITTFLMKNGFLGSYEILKAINDVDPKSFSLVQNIQEIFGGFRFSAMPYALLIAIIGLYPWRGRPTEQKHKQIIFMLVSFILLTVIHIYAAVDNNVFLYSFPAYLTFFAPMFIIGFALAIPTLNQQGNPSQTILGTLAILTFSSGVGLHIHKGISNIILNFPIPGFSGAQGGERTVRVWQIVVNKFGIEQPQQAYLFSTLGGLAMGVFFVLFIYITWKFIFQPRAVSYAYTLFIGFLVAVFVLTPTPFLSIYEVTAQCEGDAIVSFEQASLQLAKTIPPGSTVFWDTDKSPSPAMLLYLENVHLFPSQLNGRFYLKQKENFPNGLPPFAWTKEIGLDWIKQSDFVVLSERTVADWDEFLSTSTDPAYEQVNPTSLSYACDHTSYALIYKKIK